MGVGIHLAALRTFAPYLLRLIEKSHHAQRQQRKDSHRHHQFDERKI
jgi:hypothetical protein